MTRARNADRLHSLARRWRAAGNILLILLSGIFLAMTWVIFFVTLVDAMGFGGVVLLASIVFGVPVLLHAIAAEVEQ